MKPLSHDLGDDDAQPYFIWDVPLTVGELKRLLAHPDVEVRTRWAARVMREARYWDVWKFLTLEQALELFPRVRRHLGRRLAFWDFLIEGWRQDGLVAQQA